MALMLSSLLAGHHGYCCAKEAIAADLNQALVRTLEEKRDNFVSQDTIRAYRCLRETAKGKVLFAVADERFCRNLIDGRLRKKAFIAFDAADGHCLNGMQEAGVIAGDTMLVSDFYDTASEQVVTPVITSVEWEDASEFTDIDDEKAAGIFYMPSKRDLGGSGMAMNGLLRSEKDIVEAMDKQLDGEYVPKYSVTTSGQLDKRCTSFINSENFSEIFDYIEKLMRKTGEEILSGDISAKPVDGCETPACKYCYFSSVCGREGMPGTQVPSMKNSEVFEKMREDDSDGV